MFTSVNFIAALLQGNLNPKGSSLILLALNHRIESSVHFYLQYPVKSGQCYCSRVTEAESQGPGGKLPCLVQGGTTNLWWMEGLKQIVSV